MDNYLDNVEAYCNKSKLRDPLTGEEMSPDEKLMRSIEEQIESQKMLKSIREEILIRISAYARKGNASITIRTNVFVKRFRRSYLLI